MLNLCKLLELAAFTFEFEWTEYCMMAFPTKLVLFITNFGDNLFSVRTAAERGVNFSFAKNRVVISSGNKTDSSRN
jgi:hypothetical protein